VEGVSGLVSGVEDAEEVVILAEFSLFTPDVFSPHLVAYQRELLETYADLPLRGVVKDEWGFPPTARSMREHRSFWYSDFYADAYRRDSGGRCLLDDLILMAVPAAGRESERLAAINRYMMLNLRRQAEIEEAYYHAAYSIAGVVEFWLSFGLVFGSLVFSLGPESEREKGGGMQPGTV
ncbi:MAG: hypothetical protein ABIH23_19705, partial [bacterium]